MHDFFANLIPITLPECVGVIHVLDMPCPNCGHHVAYHWDKAYEVGYEEYSFEPHLLPQASPTEEEKVEILLALDEENRGAIDVEEFQSSEGFQSSTGNYIDEYGQIHRR
jgi:hypothetical protein